MRVNAIGLASTYAPCQCLHPLAASQLATLREARIRRLVYDGTCHGRRELHAAAEPARSSVWARAVDAFTLARGQGSNMVQNLLERYIACRLLFMTPSSLQAKRRGVLASN
jgi:hypothetical protein